MYERSLIRYCHFYNGETLCPKEFDGKNEGKLWQAEKIICEDMYNCIDGSNPHISLARYVGAYVGKWDPFGYHDVMETYFEKFPEARSQVSSE